MSNQEVKEMQEIIDSAVKRIKESCTLKPAAGIVLGSGLGEYIKKIDEPVIIQYNQIYGLPTSGVLGHAGQFVLGLRFGKPVIVMQGRTHYYEGYTQNELTMQVRIMKKLGIQTLVLTNAAGGINTSFIPGDLMIITDHINFSGSNPLIGPNMEEFGDRFPDMSNVYDRELVQKLISCAEYKGIMLKKGVYIMFSGPSFETPAEIRMARIWGADAVGMSTVPEAITARHCGIKVIGISCITNMAAGILDQPLSHKEVFETAEKTKTKFSEVLDLILTELI